MRFPRVMQKYTTRSSSTIHIQRKDIYVVLLQITPKLETTRALLNLSEQTWWCTKYGWQRLCLEIAGVLTSHRGVQRLSYINSIIYIYICIRLNIFNVHVYLCLYIILYIYYTIHSYIYGIYIHKYADMFMSSRCTFQVFTSTR